MPCYSFLPLYKFVLVYNMKKQKKMHQCLKLNMAKEEKDYPVIKTKVILFGKNCIKLAPLTASNF